MEFEYADDNKKRARLYMGVGLVMALLVAGIVFAIIRTSTAAGTGHVAMRQVVVAARQIPSRKPIEEGDLLTRSVPADLR